MKVLTLMPVADQRGGAEKLLHLLVGHAATSNVEWIVVFLEEGPLQSTFEDLGAETYVIEAGRLREPIKYIQTIWRIARLAHIVRADLIFSWMPKAHLYGGWAAQWAGVPAAWYQHGAPSLGWMDQITTLVPAVKVIACSEHIADMQEQLWPHRPTTVVYPAVDLTPFDPRQLPSPEETKAALGLTQDGPLIGFVGRLQQWKGVHVFVEAMPHVLERYPHAHAVIVGGEHDLEPGYLDYLVSCIESLGLTNHVTLAGYQANIPRWMQAMDIVVHASDREPFGMVIIEAMALGKPVVAGAEGGPSEIISGGTNGLLAKYGNADQLAGQILRYLDHPAWTKSVRQAARKRARDFATERFSKCLTEAVLALQPVSPDTSAVL